MSSSTIRMVGGVCLAVDEFDVFMCLALRCPISALNLPQWFVNQYPGVRHTPNSESLVPRSCESWPRGSVQQISYPGEQKLSFLPPQDFGTPPTHRFRPLGALQSQGPSRSHLAAWRRMAERFYPTCPWQCRVLDLQSTVLSIPMVLAGTDRKSVV